MKKSTTGSKVSPNKKTVAKATVKATSNVKGKTKMKTSKAKVRSVKTPPPERRKAARRPYQSPLGLDVQTLETTFRLLEPNIDALAVRFYETLFARYPSVRPLFKNTNRETQAKKLVAALKLVVGNLRTPNVLIDVLSVLGQRHKVYGALPEHYAAVATTLMDVMKEFTGDMWTSKVQEAWGGALETIAATMLKAYGKSEDGLMAASKKAVTGIVQQSEEEILRNADYAGKVAAIDKVQAVIEFNMDGTIITANNNFLNVMGYTLGEIQGKHHSMFADPAYAASAEYRSFWDKLNRGEFESKEYKRIGKGGKEVWIQASYNPIMDLNGKPFKVVKFATDITEARQRAVNGARLQGTVDGALTAIMMIDRDLVITYANESTKKLLKKNEETLRSVYPGFSADKLIGTCIDVFHKNPAHQRQLLGNPANLPYSTDIQVGPLMFNINVTAIMNGSEYVGNALEWQDVTAIRAKELEVSRLQSAVDGAQSNLMLCDDDLHITYVNPAVVSMLSKRQHDLAQVFPGFNAQNLVGKCIDMFHKNPAHQRALLKDLSRMPAKAEIKVADLEFEVNATAITDASGKYMGNMVQWVDITEQKEAERQIASLIDAAAKGDLNQRINPEEFDGFLKGLSQGINELMEAVVMPVRETKRVAELLAKGDLTEQMNGQFEGEFAELRDAINASMSNLLNMVNEIREGSANIAASAGEIAQGNSDLSQRTEEQASSLEETASSMEELTGTVTQNADNARQANQLASSARDEATKGGEVVGKAVSAMSEINSSSKKIADIIGVIDEIAFQTNLLALNAAVEAARAGEQGRGFAVVAAEVRNLAQRSAAAAKEIKSLINDSVEKVEEGTKLVDQSGETLGQIVEAIKKVSDIVAEIASASQEQASGIEQVNKAITQMDEVTQQNAALVEQAAASSESLDEQANNLDSLMNFFKVSNEPAKSGMSVRKQNTQSYNKTANQQKTANNARPSRPSPQKRSPQAGGNNGGGKYENDSEWEEF